jgi:hypothetical protein
VYGSERFLVPLGDWLSTIHNRPLLFTTCGERIGSNSDWELPLSNIGYYYSSSHCSESLRSLTLQKIRLLEFYIVYIAQQWPLWYSCPETTIITNEVFNRWYGVADCKLNSDTVQLETCERIFDAPCELKPSPQSPFTMKGLKVEEWKCPCLDLLRESRLWVRVMNRDLHQFLWCTGFCRKCGC